jgi:hypothetical protein
MSARSKRSSVLHHGHAVAYAQLQARVIEHAAVHLLQVRGLTTASSSSATTTCSMDGCLSSSSAAPPSPPPRISALRGAGWARAAGWTRASW